MKCLYCFSEIPDHAPRCPQCRKSAANQNHGSRFFVAIAIVVVLIVVLLFASCSDSNSDGSNSNTTTVVHGQFFDYYDDDGDGYADRARYRENGQMVHLRPYEITMYDAQY